MYIHILLCLGGCRTLCVTMYVASPLNLLRLLPFILKSLWQNKSGISSEPSCWYCKELKQVIFTENQECVAKPLCWSYTHCKEYLEYAIWLSEFFSMVWNPFYIKMYWKWANGGQEHGMPDEHLECNRTALIAFSSSQSNMGMVCWRLASVSKQACGGSSDHSSLAGTLLRVTLRFARDSNLETSRVITICLRCCSQNQRAPFVMRPKCIYSLCLCVCRTLCATMYVASPFNLFRLWPCILLY